MYVPGRDDLPGRGPSALLAQPRVYFKVPVMSFGLAFLVNRQEQG
jgi:hypothetical protein